MQREGYVFGMGLDYPRPTSRQSPLHYMIGRCVQARSEFNAGLFLLKPNLETYNGLIQMLNQNKYDVEMCEQGLLNAFFLNQTYVIPFKYNANVVAKACAPEVFQAHEHEAVLLHFTVAKPWMTSMWTEQWMWSCPWWGVEKECSIWNAY